MIDCDNVSYKSIEGVVDKLSKYGKVNIRNAYGNWKNEIIKGWEEKLHPHAIKPIQQFAYTKGKNATDAAMIIDAMDLLYSQKIDAFALMTSDSDFTPLVMRFLASGLIVYGFLVKRRHHYLLLEHVLNLSIRKILKSMILTDKMKLITIKNLKMN